MGAKAQCFDGDLKFEHNGKKIGKRGRIIIRAETVVESNEIYHLQFNWDNVGNI